MGSGGDVGLQSACYPVELFNTTAFSGTSEDGSAGLL